MSTGNIILFSGIGLLAAAAMMTLAAIIGSKRERVLLEERLKREY